MDKGKKSIGIFIIASAIIWGAIIISCAFKLKGTECYSQISNILFIGVAAHLLFVWAPLAIQNRKPKKEE